MAQKTRSPQHLAMTELAREIQTHNGGLKAVCKHAPPTYYWVRVSFLDATGAKQYIILERDFYSREAWIEFANRECPCGRHVHYNQDLPLRPQDKKKTEYILYISTFLGSHIIYPASPHRNEFGSEADRFEADSPEEAARRWSAIERIELTQIKEGVWKSLYGLETAVMRDYHVRAQRKDKKLPQ